MKTRIHGATPENVRALQAQGFRGLSVDELIRFRIHKVTPEEIDQFKSLGFGNMTTESSW